MFFLSTGESNLLFFWTFLRLVLLYEVTFWSIILRDSICTYKNKGYSSSSSSYKKGDFYRFRPLEIYDWAYCNSFLDVAINVSQRVLNSKDAKSLFDASYSFKTDWVVFASSYENIVDLNSCNICWRSNDGSNFYILDQVSNFIIKILYFFLWAR